MPNFLSEDDIEQAMVQRLQLVYGYKDQQTRLVVRDEVGKVLDEHLPEESYDKALFDEKRDKVFELTLDLAINHQKWAA